MVYEYSQSLRDLIDASSSPSFGAIITSISHHNANLGIRDGADVFVPLKAGYSLPPKNDMDDFLSRLSGLKPAERESFELSRVYMFMDDRGVPNEQTMLVLVALHLEFGEEIWNMSNFSQRGDNSERVVKLSIQEDPRFLEWAVKDGELTPFGLSVALLRKSEWYEVVITSPVDSKHNDDAFNKRGVLLAEAAFAVARDTDCFHETNISYPDDMNSSTRIIGDLRNITVDPSGISWLLLWYKTKTPISGLGLNGIEYASYTFYGQEKFFDTARTVSAIVPFDLAEPYMESSIGRNAEAILRVVGSGGMDMELLNNLTDGGDLP